MNYILFDSEVRNHLLPFTFTRPVCDIRIGILTIREKWEKRLKAKTSTLTEDHLSGKYPASFGPSNIFINGSVCPTDQLVKEVRSLKPGQALMSGNTLLAAGTGSDKSLFSPNLPGTNPFKLLQTSSNFLEVSRLWNIYMLNDRAIREDFTLLTKGRKSKPLSKTNKVLGAKNVFVEAGVKAECCIINATTGPVYLGKDSELMEGSVIRGPFSLGEHSTLKISTKIYGPTTIGPHCKVGGEVNNSVIFGYSNKAHDGFLGNSVIGEWVNIGADSNNSNLKNNYAEVKLWSYAEEKFLNTGTIFCGLMMGDHSKCGINTMFNTGTVVGVSANIFGSGFPRNFIPSFSWGGAAGFTTFRLKDAYEVAERVMERRNLKLSEEDKAILKYLFDLANK